MLRIILINHINYDKINNQSIQLYNYGSDIFKVYTFLYDIL